MKRKPSPASSLKPYSGYLGSDKTVTDKMRSLQEKTIHMVSSTTVGDKRKMKTNQADAQYTERNKLDLAAPRKPFPKIAPGLDSARARTHTHARAHTQKDKLMDVPKSM